ncbi:SDR family NAD(P)-dependent oxidoreductase [Streptomyces sp. NPDC059679]|uniref:SDR family NAD(P)-dependent oxidoreductase n=1 Tax=Streptomyces sp. NPDC059679 TaxID=3346903 RepID=UPI0036B4A7C6
MHPLLDQTLLKSMGQSVFLTEFTPERQWVLSEHKLLNESIVPGTTYLEMARAAASEHFGRPATEIEDVHFLTPMLVRAEERRTAHTTIRETGNGTAEFAVASQGPGGGQWTMHVQGSVSVNPLPQPAPSQDLAELRARCALEVVDVGVRQTEHQSMWFGPRWQQSLTEVHVGVRGALGLLCLPDAYLSDCADMPLHPALLDLATGFGGFAVLDGADDRQRAREDRGFFLPVGYDSLRIHAPLPPRGVSFIQPHPGYEGAQEIRKVDVVICDEAGNTAIDISGFTVKRVSDPHRTVARLGGAARHHTLRWVASSATPGGPEQPPPPRRALVVGDHPGVTDELSARLRTHGVDVTEVTLAETWDADTRAERFRVPPTAQGFGRLIGALSPNELGRLDEVMYIAGAAPDDVQRDPSALTGHLGHSVEGFFHLVKTLSEHGAPPGRLSVVAPCVSRVTGHEADTHPVHATLFGIAKSVGLENGHTDVLCLDIAPDTSLEAVCAELLGARVPGAVALRDGRRHVAELVPVDLAATAPPGASRPDGVYLITGGLGGLGLAVARQLSRSVPGIRLALVGRTPVPPPGRWDGTPETDDRLRARIETLRELTANGARVRTYHADVTDLAQMAAVVRAVRDEWGAIGCVVHAAGVAGDGFLFRKDWDTFRQTLAPKVLGATVLDLVTDDEPPALMVNFGSTASVFGAAGQSDYTAANSYLDHFAEHRTARGRPTVTVGWSDWIGVGMASDHGVQRDQGFFRSLSAEDGIGSFEEVLVSRCTRVIVGEINHGRLAAPESDGPSTADPGGRSAADPDVTLLGRESGRYSELEIGLTRIWAKELGLTELNIHASFFDLGIDSLNALRMAQNIEKRLALRVSMADLFRYASIAELSAYLTDGKRKGGSS